MEQPRDLRELANWYRNWAELGNKADRGWREGFAAYLERRAADIELLSGCTDGRPAYVPHRFEGSPLSR